MPLGNQPKSPYTHWSRDDWEATADRAPPAVRPHASPAAL